MKAARKLIRRRAKELGVDVTTLPGFGGKAKAADTPPWQVPADTISMDTRSLVIRTLDLPAEADEAAVVKALAKLTKKARRGSKPLKILAAEKGLILLDADRLTKLERDAAGRAAAEQQPRAQRFDHAFELALTDPRGARVKPAERDTLKRFYTLDAEGTIKLLEDREPILQARPLGPPAIDLTQEADADPEQLAAQGIYPAGHQLDQKVKARLRELGQPMSDYPNVLDQMMREAA